MKAMVMHSVNDENLKTDMAPSLDFNTRETIIALKNQVRSKIHQIMLPINLF